MKAAFHYLVKAKIIKKLKGEVPVFSEVNKTFENTNPIIARNEAFSFYQSWIDILLDYKGKKYYTDKEARIELLSFVDTDIKATLSTGKEEIEFSTSSFGNGVGVFFVPDVEPNFDTYKICIGKGDECLIHGIGHFWKKNNLDNIILCLHTEVEFYKHFGYEAKNKEVDILYCLKQAYDDDWESDGWGHLSRITHRVLETPFDWEGYDKPYWWGNSPNETIKEISQPVSKTIEEIIDEGENNTVEFKPTLVYNFKTNKGGVSVKQIIARTICSFLNSNGGVLFIGINDNKSVQGLKYDFSLANGKDPKDFFLLEFDQMLSHFLGSVNTSNIDGRFYSIDGKDIFIVTVSPNKRRPIFLKTQEGKEFYIRGQASSRQLKDTEEIINYWLERVIK